jgi:hypothetical protein
MDVLVIGSFLLRKTEEQRRRAGGASYAAQLD